MINSLIDGKWYSFSTFTQAFQLQTTLPEVVSLVGGGGKTTIIRHLQKEYRKLLICHGVSTTTHMQYKKDRSFLDEESLEGFFHVYHETGTAWMGIPVEMGKMRGMSIAFLEQLYKKNVTLFLEADGAKYLPVKCPAEHEPVIVPFSTVVVNVYGLDGLGSRIEEKCFRSEKLAAFLKKEKEDLLEADDIRKLAVSTDSGRKNVPDQSSYQVVLNKADLVPDVDAVRSLAEKIQKECGCPVHITGDLLRGLENEDTD